VYHQMQQLIFDACQRGNDHAQVPNSHVTMGCRFECLSPIRLINSKLSLKTLHLINIFLKWNKLVAIYLNLCNRHDILGKKIEGGHDNE
jgi:hypothetical protein